MNPLRLTVFLSSPGDVLEERDAARRLVDRLNKDHLLSGRVALEAVSWDDPDAPASMPANLRPQQAVDRGLPKPSDCDIVVVLLWNRMGTELTAEDGLKPNGEPYLSGTEWEYTDAVDAPSQPQRPAVLLYRRTGFNPDASDPDSPAFREALDQRRKVNGFFDAQRQRKRFAVEVSGPAEFKQRLENDLKHQISLRLGRGAATGTSGSVADGRPEAAWHGSPYPGLRALEEDDAAVFFGRGREVEALVERLSAREVGFVAVVGISGSGKSSMLRAGLVPRLRADALPGSAAWPILGMRPTDQGSDPFLALANPMFAALPAPHRPRGGPKVLAATLRAAPGALVEIARAGLQVDGGDPKARLVLLVDQAEELFASVAEADRARFIELVARAATAPGLLVLWAMRADFFAEASRDETLATLLRDGTFALAPPGPAALADMIRRPAALAGAAVPDDLVDAILAETGSSPGALPLVAFCLSELWPQVRGSIPSLSLSAYERLGRLAGAIERRAAAVMGEIDAAARDAMPRLFQQLVHVNADGTATRRRVAKRDLAADPEQARLAEALIAGRLLTGGEAAAAQVSVAHEVLFDGWLDLKAWIGENRERLMLRTELDALRRRWEREGRSPDFLLAAGRSLQDALRLERERPELLLPGTAEFLAASRAAWQAELRGEVSRLADFSRRETVSGDAVTGILLALEALDLAAGGERPYIVDAAMALREAIKGRRELMLLRGHQGAVLCAAFDPSGARVVTGSWDGTACIWDAAGARPLVVLRGHAGPVWSVALKDGRALTASADGTAALWDADRGTRLVVLAGHQKEVRSAAFSPDGTLVATGSADGTVRLWDARTGAPRSVLSRLGGVVFWVAFSRDGARIVTASTNYAASVWETASGALAVALPHASPVRSVAFGRDASRVVTACADGTARIWDVAGAREVAVLRGHTGPVRSIDVSPDGRSLLTASEDRTARLWAMDTGDELLVLRGHEGALLSGAFGPDGSRVVTASWDNTARIWDAAPSGGQDLLLRHSDQIHAAAFDRGGDRIVTASADGTARVWSAATGEELLALRGHSDWVYQAAFSPDGARIATGSSDGTARIWDAGSGEQLAVLEGHDDWVYAVAFAGDGACVATAGRDGTARLWDARSGRARRAPVRHDAAVRSVALSRDGAQLLTGCQDGLARLWDARTGEARIVLRGHADWVVSVAFSPDETRALTTSWDATARIWCLRTANPLLSLQGHERDEAVRCAAFDPDGTRVATAGDDRTARLWDAATGELLAVLRGHTQGVRCVAFSPDGKWLLTASQDGSARLWRIPSDGQVQSLIDQARRIVPRQLSRVQRRRFQLAAALDG